MIPHSTVAQLPCPFKQSNKQIMAQTTLPLKATNQLKLNTPIWDQN